jgi:hypothetical protein
MNVRRAERDQGVSQKHPLHGGDKQDREGNRHDPDCADHPAQKAAQERQAGRKTHLAGIVGRARPFCNFRPADRPLQGTPLSSVAGRFVLAGSK